MGDRLGIPCVLSIFSFLHGVSVYEVVIDAINADLGATGSPEPVRSVSVNLSDLFFMFCFLK